ncbi:hypothetical protein OS493_004685 [Desmophyllum pertusum]|uniref:Uncharacterized protein n=1 Tax=Desmophyllum pertusum TaxID=174260 RepID=A0A9X0CYY8_9CNID|nr:hypothetical protein OS493_004685 [Desmophyllum pertusum]
MPLGNRVKTPRRFRRQVVKEGRCPSWTIIRNCSLLEQCDWDGDCSGSQKCCKSTCETRSCYESILAIGPGEDACPKDESTVASNKHNSNCFPGRTRFCFKSNCKRCCYHHGTCNPHPELLMSRDECRRVLCSPRVCDFPGEVCVLDKYNSPRCSCRSKCPTPSPGENVCGTDGIPTKAPANWIEQLAFWEQGISRFITMEVASQVDGVKVQVSAAHKSKQLLPAYKQGELTCRFEGDPVSITWKKVGLRTLPNRMIPRMDKLYILDVDMRDGGMYKCKAYDGFFSAEAEINVTINGPSTPKNGNNMSRTDCLKPRNTGYCKRYAVRWYFDGKDGVCRQFAYSGCGGNKNNFQTQTACSSACSHAAGDICTLPMIEGPCKGFMPRWFYNSKKGRCEQFVYGGCSGNANRFNTKTQCQLRCAVDPSANTPCLRQQFEARRNKRLGVFVPRCLPDGGYDKIQCHESVCFCMDEEGEEVPGTRVNRQHPLNCTGTSQVPPVGDLTACQRAQQNASGVPFGTSYLIRCKQDGSYEEVQCSGSTGYCWCVDKNGTERAGSKTRGPLKCPVLGIRLTLCQQRYQENSRSPRPDQEIPKCRPDGSFEEVQCRGVVCFCVDPENGRTVKDTNINTLYGEPKCGDTGQGLTHCQRMHQEALSSSKEGFYVPQCNLDGDSRMFSVMGPAMSVGAWIIKELS